MLRPDVHVNIATVSAELNPLCESMCQSSEGATIEDTSNNSSCAREDAGRHYSFLETGKVAMIKSCSLPCSAFRLLGNFRTSGIIRTKLK